MDFVNRTFRHWSLFPAVALFVVLTIYPVANLFRMSVSTVEFAQGGESWTFTPMRNIELLRTDEVIPAAVRNTLVFVVAAVAIEMFLGLALAIMVSFALTLGKAFKTIRPIFRERSKINAEVTGRLTESLGGVASTRKGERAMKLLMDPRYCWGTAKST